MRASSKIVTRGVVIVMLAAAPAAADPVAPAAAGPDAMSTAPPSPQLPATSLTPLALYPHATGEPEVECAPAGQTRFRFLEWWRQWFSSHRQRREVREDELDRSAVTPFYLRSPLLSGFVGRADSTGCAGGAGAVRAPEARDECVELNLAPDSDRPVRIQLAMPQLQVTSARRLSAVVNDKLARGETAVLLLRNGHRYPVGPALTQRVEARGCPTEEPA